MATAPGGGSGDGSSGPNWLGLLKWSLKYQDGTQDSSEHAALSDEKRQFLEKAMQEAFVDVVKKMKDGIDELEAIAEAAAPAVTVRTNIHCHATTLNPLPVADSACHTLMDRTARPGPRTARRRCGRS